MTLLMAGMMNGNLGNVVTYRNGNESKLRDSDIKAEYELIKQKKSDLPANVRKAIVRHVERNKGIV